MIFLQDQLLLLFFSPALSLQSTTRVVFIRFCNILQEIQIYAVYTDSSSERKGNVKITEEKK